jgi:hypothetical protein
MNAHFAEDNYTRDNYRNVASDDRQQRIAIGWNGGQAG